MPESNQRPNITVVGDLILDRYLIGDATKLNPEMPGVVIRIDQEDDRLGGAAAVAMIAAGFEARVTLAGVVGNDEAGDKLRQLIDEHGLESHIWTDERPTTWKQRIVARGQLRPDRCDREVTTPIGQDAEHFLSNVTLGDVLMISDYGKGVCSKRLLQMLADRAAVLGVPILVDPARSRDWSDYSGATLVKANLVEATEAWNSDPVPPETLAQHLSAKYTCHVVITLGEHGLVCAEQGDTVRRMSGRQVEVRDVCGAGDTVLAVLGFLFARGISIPEACESAIYMAGEQVANFGIGVSRLKMLDSKQSVKAVA